MLRLVLMRHAEAEPPRGRRDSARPLSNAGVREAEAAGRSLAEAGLVPDLVLVSDSIRTVATLDHVSLAYSAPPPSRVLPALYGAAPGTILAAIRDIPGEVRTALVIGHNPGLGDLARSLARTGDAADLAALQAHFPTACRAVLALDDDEWLGIAPGRLERLFGGKHG